MATTKTLAQAKAEAAAAKAAQDRAIAAEVAAAAAQKAQQQAVLKAAQQALKDIPTATNQQQLDTLVKQVQAAGLTVPAADLKTAQAAVATATKATADKLAAQQAADKAAADARAKAANDAAAAAQKTANDARAAADAKAAELKAAADKAAADKAAAAKAAADKAAADAQAAKEKAAADAKTAAAVKAGTAYNQDLLKATTQADIDAIQAKAKAAGATLDQGYIDQATKKIQLAQQAAEQASARETAAKAQAEAQAKAQAEAQAKAQAIATQNKLNDTWTAKIQAAKTPAEIADQAQQAKAAGAVVPDNTVTGALRSQFLNYSQSNHGAYTQSQLDDLQAQAKAAGVELDAGTVQQAQKTIDMYAAAAPQRAQALEEAHQVIVNATDPNQIKFWSGIAKTDGIPIDPTWIDQGNANIKATELAKPFVTQLQQAQSSAQAQDIIKQMQAAGGSIPQKDIDVYTGRIAAQEQAAAQAQSQREARTKAEADAVAASQARAAESNAAIQSKQAAADAAAAATAKDFESKLPDPASLPNGAVRYAQGGTTYYLAPVNQATGQPGSWVKQDPNGAMTDLATGKPTTASAYDAQTKAVQSTNNQIVQQQRAAAAEAAKNSGGFEDFINSDFGKLFTVAVIGSVVGPLIGDALSGIATTSDVAGAAAHLAETGATTEEIAATLQASGVPAEAATTVAETATGIANGTVDAQALGAANGITTEAVTAAAESANPLAAVNETIAASTPASTVGAIAPEAGALTNGAVAPLTELNAAETANLMRNIDPNMISSLAPTGAGTAGGTAGSILSGSSLNPITNVLTNLGVTNPIVSGALTGAGTGAAINAITGRPITGDSLLTGALGGGVAGGIGSVLPDMGGGIIGSGLAGAATNVGATVAVNLVTGQPITAGSLAGAALIGGAVGAGIQVATDAAGNNTYQYEDGSSMTTNRTGTPVAVTDTSGAQVPVAAVDSRTGQPKQLAPVEEAQARTPEQIANTTTTPAPVAPQGVDVGNMTQEQLNQVLSQNNPYATASEPTQVAGPYTPAQEAQYKQLVAEGRTPAEATDIVESGQDTGPAVPVSITGAAGTAEAPGYAVPNQMTPGTQLANQTEIDSGQARFNEAANAWEVTPTVTPAPAPVAVVPTSSAQPSAVAPSATAPVDEIPGIVITADRPKPVVPPVYVPPALTPPVQQVIPPSQPIPEVRAETPADATAPSEPVAPSYPPVYVPPVAPPQVQMPTYGPLGPTQWGQVGTVNLPGTNPGFFTNVPAQYATNNMQQSQFYWGQHPYQTGERFSPEQYRNVPNAPVAPYGLQQMYNPQTQTIENLLRGVGQAAVTAPYNQPAAPRV